FVPGALSLHNQMSGHGPDVASWQGASAVDLAPHKLNDTMAFMIESRWVFRPTDFALEAGALDADYDAAWGGFPRRSFPDGLIPISRI
ncbi:homogentisate 1,2-dioxygenase, partial [Pseudomonas sp. FW215-R2]|uniref:homogentisate 1,2-dioxygenase domain-containing protein n=1 Tax=Pseudomonas sp. FW215-R2 TaxID=2070615 RepID=UPI000CBCD4CE